MWPSTGGFQPYSRPSDWSPDYDSPDLTDDDFVPTGPGGIPLPESTIRRYEGYNPAATFSRHFNRQNFPILAKQQAQQDQHVKALLPQGIPTQLSLPLQGVFEDLKKLEPTQAYDQINKITLDSDRQQLLAHYTAYSHFREMAMGLEQNFKQRVAQNGMALNMALVPSNLDDPLAWAQLPLAEAQYDLPTSDYSRFLQTRLATDKLIAGGLRNAENLTLFETSNPFYFAQQAHSRDLDADTMRSNFGASGVLGDASGSQGGPASSPEVALSNSASLKSLQEQRLQMLTNVTAVQTALRNVNKALHDVTNQLTAAGTGSVPQNSVAGSFSDTTSIDTTLSQEALSQSSSMGYGSGMMLPSKRHQLLINLSALQTQRTSLETQYKTLTQNRDQFPTGTGGGDDLTDSSAEYWDNNGQQVVGVLGRDGRFDPSGAQNWDQGSVDLTDTTSMGGVSSMGSANSDTTHIRGQNGQNVVSQNNNNTPSPAQEWSYLSYLNPWAYGSSNTDTNNKANAGNEVKGQNGGSYSASSYGTTTSIATTTTSFDSSLLSPDPVPTPLSTPQGYNVALPNAQFLHIDIAHLSHLDQATLKSRELLEDAVAVMFSDPSFISAYWDVSGLNSFVEMYNSQEDTRWNLYKQLLQAWYLSKFPERGGEAPEEIDGKHDISKNDPLTSRLTPETWHHLSTELKQFKALMDVQFFGILDQVRQIKAKNGGKLPKVATATAPNTTTNPSGLPTGLNANNLSSTQSALPFYMIANNDGPVLEERLQKLFFPSVDFAALTHEINETNRKNETTNLSLTRPTNPTFTLLSNLHKTLPSQLSPQLPIPKVDEFSAVAYYEPYTDADAASLPDRFSCIKSIFIHLFNTNRLSNDYRILIDIDLTDLSNPQYIFIDPTNQTNQPNRITPTNQNPSTDLSLPLLSPPESIIIQGKTVSLTKSPTATLFFDPSYGKKVVHWTQKPWAKDIIIQRRNLLNSIGASANEDGFDQADALFPGTEGYLEHQAQQLHRLQDSLGLVHTDLPPEMVQRHESMLKERNKALEFLKSDGILQNDGQAEQNNSTQLSSDIQKHFQPSPGTIKRLWAEDEKSINMLVMAQQRTMVPDESNSPTPTSPSLSAFNAMAKYAQIPSLFHPLHGIDQFFSTQQAYLNAKDGQGNSNNSKSPSFFSNFISNQTPDWDSSSKTSASSVAVATKRDIQLYDYLQHYLSQKVLEFTPEYPHLEFIPIASPLGFVQGDLLPPVNPIFTLVPDILAKENRKNPFKNQKFRALLHFINTALPTSPTAVPLSLELLDQVKSKRREIKEEQELIKNSQVLFDNGHILAPLTPKIVDPTQRPTSPFAYNPLTTPILNNPVTPHPRDFRAVLLWDSLDPEQRRIFSLPRREPKTGATAWQDAEYSRPGLERHPFNRAYVRTGDSYNDIIGYKGGLEAYGLKGEPDEAERMKHYEQWCDLYPEQAFNRQVIDMLKDHAYISSHPSMKEYMRRRLQWNFGRVKKNIGDDGDDEGSSQGQNGPAKSSSSKWDSDIEDGDDDNDVGAAGKGNKGNKRFGKDNNEDKAFVQRYNESEFDSLDYIFSPSELANLGNITIPAELAEHPFTKVYVQHESRMYKSRYLIASKIVSKQLRNLQAQYRSNYMNIFKKELGLDDVDIKIHTNTTRGTWEEGTLDQSLNDDDDDEAEGEAGSASFFTSMINTLRFTLGLPPMPTSKSYIDSRDSDWSQFPFIFGIPTVLQEQIEKELKPKTSETVFLEHIPSTQQGNTSSPILKPYYQIKTITPLTQQAVDNINKYINEWERTEKIRLGLLNPTTNTPTTKTSNTQISFTPHPRAVLNKPLSGPIISQLTGTIQLTSKKFDPAAALQNPNLAPSAENGDELDPNDPFGINPNGRNELQQHPRLYSLTLEPYPEPTYLDKLNYYDQSYYLFGMKPYEADKELREKYELNSTYMANRHAADEHGLTLYKYLGLIQSLITKSNPQYNKVALERKTMLDKLINEQNEKLTKKLDQKRNEINNLLIKNDKNGPSLTDIIKDAISPFAPKANDIKSRYASTPAANAEKSRTMRTLAAHPTNPEIGNEHLLDDDDLATIKFRNGLIDELDTLPKLSASGTNVGFLQQMLEQKLGHLPLDPKTGTTIGSHLGLPSLSSFADGNGSSSEFKDPAQLYKEKVHNLIAPVFEAIHGSQIEVEPVTQPLPLIIAVPVTDAQTGEEYLEWHESRVTTDGHHVWKKLEWDLGTGEFLNDSIEPFTTSPFFGSRLFSKPYTVTFTRADGTAQYEGKAELLPRHYSNVFDIIGKDREAGFQRARSQGESFGSELVPRKSSRGSAFAIKGAASEFFENVLNSPMIDAISMDPTVQDESNFESLKNFNMVKSGQAASGSFLKPLEDQLKPKRAVGTNEHGYKSPFVAEGRYMDFTQHESHLKTQVQLRRDQSALSLLQREFQDDPFLGELYEQEVGPEFRKQLWKRQDQMLREMQQQLGYEEVLVPNHKFDSYFTGDVRDYIIDPEVDSEELQEEKVVRRRLLVRPLPDAPVRQFTAADIIATPRRLAGGITLDLTDSYNSVQLQERLQHRQLEKQTKAELWKRYQQEKKDREAKRKQEEAQNMSHFNVGLAKGFGITMPDAPKSEQQAELDRMSRAWGQMKAEIVSVLLKLGLDTRDFDANPDYYIDLYTQIREFKLEQQRQAAQAAASGAGADENATAHAPQLAALGGGFMDGMGAGASAVSPALQVASRHLYDTLFGNNSNSFNLDPQQQEAQLKLKQQLKQTSSDERSVEKYRRALLSFGVLPQEFDTLFQQRRQEVLMQQAEQLRAILDGPELIKQVKALEGGASTPSSKPLVDISQYTDLTTFDREILGRELFQKAQEFANRAPGPNDVYSIVFDLSDKSLLDVQDRLNRQKSYNQFAAKRRERMLKEERFKQQLDPLRTVKQSQQSVIDSSLLDDPFKIIFDVGSSDPVTNAIAAGGIGGANKARGTAQTVQYIKPPRPHDQSLYQKYQNAKKTSLQDNFKTLFGADSTPSSRRTGPQRE